jgi:hypothetical protein
VLAGSAIVFLTVLALLMVLVLVLVLAVVLDSTGG